MTPERFATLRHQATEAHAMDRDALNEALDEIEHLQKAGGSPGVMHEVDRGFYDLTVQERDLERRHVDRLKIEVRKLTGELAQFQHDERVGKVGFCAIRDCSLCPPSQYAKPETRTNCPNHKGFKENCGCP